jgi:hypothetical protein
MSAPDETSDQHQTLPGVPAGAEAQQHQTLPVAPAGPTPQHLMCRADGGECEVMARIMPALTELCRTADGATTRLNESLSQVRPRLACDHCRGATAAAERLPGTRLGQRERDLLLRIAPAESNTGELVCAPGGSRALKEAKKRAARKLVHAGLIWTGYREVDIDRRAGAGNTTLREPCTGAKTLRRASMSARSSPA